MDHNEIGRRYYQRPIDLIPGEIVEKQNTDVDSVSGATSTSKAIMAAVEEALLKLLSRSFIKTYSLGQTALPQRLYIKFMEFIGFKNPEQFLIYLSGF